MPIIAESGPVVLGQGGTPVPPPTSTPAPRTPAPTRPPSRTPAPATQPPVYSPQPGSSGFVARHQQFIDRVQSIGACFKREDLPDFSDQEFSDHVQVAQQDRYLAQADQTRNIFCNMQAVSALANSLKRITGEQLIL